MSKTWIAEPLWLTLFPKYHNMNITVAIPK